MLIFPELNTRACAGCTDFDRCELQHRPHMYEGTLTTATQSILNQYDTDMAELRKKIDDFSNNPTMTAAVCRASIDAVSEDIRILETQTNVVVKELHLLQTLFSQLDTFMDQIPSGRSGQCVIPSQLAWEMKVARFRSKHLVRRADAKLPIFAFAEQLVTSVRNNAVTIVLADTGSGKSTQVAAILADTFLSIPTKNDSNYDPNVFLTPYLVCPRLTRHLGELRRQTSEEDSQAHLRVRRLIVVTQPRKLAARSLAERVAQEWGCRVGEEIGFDCGSEKMLSDRTLIKFVTDKVLLAESIRDPLLQRYRIVCVDEAHERTVDTDLLLGRLKSIVDSAEEAATDDRDQLPQSSTHGLRVVVMSATLDPALFQNYFTNYPEGVARVPTLLRVPGRTFPIDIRYQPAPNTSLFDTGIGDSYNASFVTRAIDAAIAIHTDPEAEGDVLVFLPSAEHVEFALTNTTRILRGLGYSTCVPIAGTGGAAFGVATELMLGDIVFSSQTPTKGTPTAGTPGTVVLVPLHGGVDPQLQQAAFINPGPTRRKIVFSTVVAETSVTIDGLRWVVDCGYSKEVRFDAKRQMTVLEVGPVSQSSARQRAGRAGRTAPGVCIRLYSEVDFNTCILGREPEISRTSATSTVLKILKAGVPNPTEFPFIERPPTGVLESAIAALHSLGAIHRLSDDAATAGYNEWAITEEGEVLATLPVEPALGKLMLEGLRRGLFDEGVSIAAVAAASAAQSPFRYEKKPSSAPVMEGGAVVAAGGAVAAVGGGIDATEGLVVAGATDADTDFTTGEKLEAAKLRWVSRGGELCTGLSLFYHWRQSISRSLASHSEALAHKAAVVQSHGEQEASKIVIPRADVKGANWCAQNGVRIKVMRDISDSRREIIRCLTQNLRFFPRGAVRTLVAAAVESLQPAKGVGVVSAPNDVLPVSVGNAAASSLEEKIRDDEDDVDDEEAEVGGGTAARGDGTESVGGKLGGGCALDTAKVVEVVIDDSKDGVDVVAVADDLNGGVSVHPGASVFCSYCNVTCTSLTQYEQHITGQKHLKKSVGLLGTPPPPPPPPLTEWHCIRCNVFCTSEQQMVQHLGGTRHASAILPGGPSNSGGDIQLGEAAQADGTEAQIKVLMNAGGGAAAAPEEAKGGAAGMTQTEAILEVDDNRDVLDSFETETVPVLQEMFAAALFANTSRIADLVDLSSGLYLCAHRASLDMSAYSALHVELALKHSAEAGKQEGCQEQLVCMHTGLSSVKTRTFVKGLCIVPLSTLLRIVPTEIAASLQIQSMSVTYTRRAIPMQSRLVVEEMSLNRGQFEAHGVAVEIDVQLGTASIRSSPQEAGSHFEYVEDFISKAKQRIMRRVRPFPLNGSVVSSGGYVMLVGAGGKATDILSPTDSVRVLLTWPADNDRITASVAGVDGGEPVGQLSSHAALDEAIVTELLRAGVSPELKDHGLPCDARVLDTRHAYVDFASVAAAAEALKILNRIDSSSRSGGVLKRVQATAVDIHSSAEATHGIKIIWDRTPTTSEAMVTFTDSPSRTVCRHALAYAEVGIQCGADFNGKPGMPVVALKLAHIDTTTIRNEFMLHGLLTHIGAKNISKVAMKHEPPPVPQQITSAAERVLVQNTISDMLATHLGECISCIVADPPDLYSQGTGSSVVQFERPETAQRVLKMLGNARSVPFHHGRGELRARIDHSARISVPPIVSNAIKIGFRNRVNEITDHFARAGHLIWLKWDLKKASNGAVTNATFIIDAEREGVVAAARTMASSYIDGTFLPIQNDRMFRWLFGRDSTEAKLQARHLAEQQESGGVFIHMDRDSRAVKLHGSQAAVRLAIASLLSAYDAYAAAQRHEEGGVGIAAGLGAGEVSKTLSLSAVTFQAVIAKHGSLKLFSDSLTPPVRKITLKPKKFVNQLSYTVAVVGTALSLGALQAALRAINTEASAGSDEAVECTCPWCMDSYCYTVGSDQGFPLVGCSCMMHTVREGEDGGGDGKSCAERILEVSLDSDNARYGKLTCLGECGSPTQLCIDDIVGLTERQQLVNHLGVARHFFALQNRGKWVECSSGAHVCKMMFRARRRDDAFSGITCPGCAARFCVACLAVEGIVREPHPNGLTCIEHLGALGDGIAQDPLQGLDPMHFGQCPQCHVLVERVNGCTHLHCTQCGADFYINDGH